MTLEFLFLLQATTYIEAGKIEEFCLANNIGCVVLPKGTEMRVADEADSVIVPTIDAKKPVEKINKRTQMAINIIKVFAEKKAPITEAIESVMKRLKYTDNGVRYVIRTYEGTEWKTRKKGKNVYLETV